MPFVESFEEFATRHGYQATFIGNFWQFVGQMEFPPMFLNSRWLFPNGAQSDEQHHADPPAHGPSLVALQIEYEKARLKQLTGLYASEFDAIQTQIQIFESGMGPPPEGNWNQVMQQMAHRIEQSEARLRSLESSTEAPNYELKKMKQYQANLRAEQAKQLRESLDELPLFDTPIDVPE